MGVRVVFPDMGKDPSVQLIEKTITENGTYDAITDGANGYSKVNVNVEGGGSSDFSTAILTITNTRNNPVVFEAPCYRDGAEVLTTRAIAFPAVGDIPQTATFNVVCKSNGATLTQVTTGISVETTGNIQYVQDQNLYIITGDCTITIS